MIKRLFKSLACLAFILVLTLALSELAVRLVGYSTIYFYDPIYMPFAENSEIPFVLKPDMHDVRAHGNILINTDHLGLRNMITGKTYGPKAANEFRIAVLGDSVTFGYGVKTEDTYSYVLEQMLNKASSGCKVTVFNFGVSSYSVKEMAATLRERAIKIDPDLVLVGVIYGDFDTGRTPGLDKDGYNTHSATSRLFSNYPVVKSILRNIHLTYAVRDVIGAVKVHSDRKANAAELPPTYSYLRGIKEFADSRNIPCIMATLPSLGGDGSEFKPVIGSFKKDHIGFCDLSMLTGAFTPEQFKASRFDSYHPSKPVHEKMAAMLKDFISKTYIPKRCTGATD